MTIVIIGAGMAGLSAARTLADRHAVVLFDKSRGVGGRMSTRYAGAYEFDHGAQYFTVTDPEFQALIDALQDGGAAARWNSRGFYLKTGELSGDTGRPRWVGAPRMNSVPKALAEGLDIRLGRRVTSIEGEAGDVHLCFDDGSKAGPYKHVICTAPAPQAAALLPETSPLQDALTGVTMHACFALMIGFPDAFDPGWDTLRINDLPISWIARNSAKPGRPGRGTSLVVHAAPDWSDAHAEADRDWVQTVMLEAASALCGLKLRQADHLALHRWLYAYADGGLGALSLIDREAGISLAGDWCVGGRVEGAVLSGRDAANNLFKAD